MNSLRIHVPFLMPGVIQLLKVQSLMIHIWGRAVNIALAIACFGVVGVFLRILTALVSELIRPARRRLSYYMTGLRLVRRKQNLVVMPIDSRRGKPLKKTGESVAMLALLC